MALPPVTPGPAGVGWFQFPQDVEPAELRDCKDGGGTKLSHPTIRAESN